MSTMVIKICSDDYHCEICFDRHFIVIKGDSGVGKTEFVELINENARDVKIESTLPCIPLTDLAKTGSILQMTRNLWRPVSLPPCLRKAFRKIIILFLFVEQIQ